MGQTPRLMDGSTGAAERIRSHRDRLTPTERRVADVVLADPQAVAFGTVAEVAAAAGTSGASVVRLAAKLGFDGFTGLQSQVQDDLSRRLRPATERIRLPAQPDLLDRTLATEVTNLQRTFERIDRDQLDAAVGLLADPGHHVFVLFSESTHGLGAQFTAELGTLRPGVTLVSGSEVAVLGALAGLDAGDLVVAVDLPRYDRWLLAAARHAAARGGHLVALTDSELSPLGRLATHSFTIAAEGTGPFDSHVGLLGLLGALVAAVAAELREPAAARLDRIEAAWTEAGALLDDE